MRHRIIVTIYTLVIMTGVFYACSQKNKTYTEVELQPTPGLQYNYAPVCMRCVEKLYQNSFVYDYPELSFDADTIVIPSTFYKAFVEDVAAFKEGKKQKYHWYIWYNSEKGGFVSNKCN